jgi:hypothetical protein
VEKITEESSAPGERHATIFSLNVGYDVPGAAHIGRTVIKSWPGEHPFNAPAPAIAANQSLVTWMFATDWLPFQRKTFNTPAFPGYVSGHSSFSRAAAEALRLITGSPYFPGGYHSHTVAANSLQIDLGPSLPVKLQWASYADAADQAGQSRRWGGIHVSEDDYHGRIIGSQAGIQAYHLAESYWTGQILQTETSPSLTPAGSSTAVSWTSNRGMFYRVYTSPQLQTWTAASPVITAYSTVTSWTDPSPAPGRKFYKVVRSTSSVGL